MRLSTAVLSFLSVASVVVAAVVPEQHIEKRQSSPAVRYSIDASNKTKNNFEVHAMLETNLSDLSDGGLLAELLVNHAFQDQGFSQWSALGGATVSFAATGGVTTEIPYNVAISPGGAGIGISNPGWAGGIGVQAVQYSSFFYARADKAGTVPMKVGVHNGNTSLAESTVINAGLTTQWQRFTANFTSTKTSSGGSNFRITLPNGASTKVYIAYTSLTAPFWRGQPLRSDIAQAYADLKPTFIRLPGGNDLEGNTQATRYRWNLTLGDITHRPGRLGTWTGYNTETLGLHELLNFAESVGAQAMFGTYAGYSLDHSLSPDINAIAQEVVDELHYITDTSGPFADRRAANGRKNPWTLTKVEIGNEDFISPATETYQNRFNVITSAINKSFGAGRFELVSTWTGISGWKAVDLHDYERPAFFRQKWRRFDSLPRNGTIYYEDEFAVINSGLGDPNENVYSGPNRLKYSTLDAALSEAIYMLGMERNGDIVHGAAYAPGGGSTVYNQWTPNLINFDPSGVSRSVSYYAQQGFSLFRTTNNLNSVTASVAPETSNIYQNIGQDASGNYVIRVVNYNSSPKTVEVAAKGVRFTASGSTKWQLNSAGKTNLQAANTIDARNTITSTQGALAASEVASSGALSLNLPAYSFTVVTVKAA